MLRSSNAYATTILIHKDLEQVIALDEAIGHPKLASDRAMLQQVQAERGQG
jgi:hypothetical protein